MNFFPPPLVYLGISVGKSSIVSTKTTTEVASGFHMIDLFSPNSLICFCDRSTKDNTVVGYINIYFRATEINRKIYKVID